MTNAMGRTDRCCCGLALVLLASSFQAHAETLREAVGRALATNPDLRAERAGQRVREDEIAIARAPGLPQIGATADYIENIDQIQNVFLLPRRELNAGADVIVPLFRGGAIRNRTVAARQRAAAAEDSLNGYQAELLATIVSTYSDVIREEAVEALNRDNVRSLDVNLRAAQARFRAGELTRTDIAQSEARLAFGRAALERAEANSLKSREAYLRITGLPPSDLSPPTLRVDLPDTVDTAETLALDRHPALRSARKEVEASRADVAAARAGGSPRVSGFVGGAYYNYLESSGSTNGVAVPPRGVGVRAGLQLQVPIFQGGLVKAQTRQAQNLRLRAEERRDSIERIVVERVRYAFADVRANDNVVIAASTAVAASELSLRGVRAENRVGARTVLDILNAEQELLNSKVQLISAKHDAFVSVFMLLVETGLATKDVFVDFGNINWGKPASSMEADTRSRTGAN